MCYCDVCGLIFFSKYRFINHQQETGPCTFIKGHCDKTDNIDRFICEFCGECFIQKFNYDQHKKPMFKQYTFSTYGPKFTRPGRHEFKCKTVEKHSLLVTCQNCLQKCSSLNDLRKHVKCHPIEEFNIQCNKCNMYFYFKKDLDEHTIANR